MFGKGYGVVITDIGNSGNPGPNGVSEVFAGRVAGMALLNGLRAAFTRSNGPQAPTLITSCGEDGSFMSVTPAADMRKLVQRYRDLGTKVTYVPAKCDDTELITNTYRWTTTSSACRPSTGSTRS